MKRYFLGIDIGTFESRGILIDESFRVAADASVPHGMDNPQPGWFEQDAEAVWWGDLCKLCRTLIKQSEIRPEQIACVGTSALAASASAVATPLPTPRLPPVTRATRGVVLSSVTSLLLRWRLPGGRRPRGR